jgi:hypothetical protein
MRHPYFILVLSPGHQARWPNRRLQAILAFVFVTARLLATSECGGGSASNGATDPPSLSSLAITPANPSIGAGQNQHFMAEGSFSDGTKQNLTSSVIWMSSNTNVATINASGMAIGATQGNSNIGASSGSNDFVAWPNQGNSFYILTPDPVNQRLTCQKSTFAGGPPNSSHTGLPNSTNGTFGRFQYFPGPDVFVIVNDWNIPTYVLRLR